MNPHEQEALLRAHIEALGLEVDGKAPARLRRYHEMLCDWNTRMNLTGETDFSAALDRLYMDSLAPLAMGGMFPSGATLIDVGSGAGFPGLPLAIAQPDMQVTLLDTLAKRVGFLEAVAGELGLTNVQTLHARAEDAGHLPAMRESFDIAVARAVAALPVLCELLLPFVKVGGRMICYKGPSVQEEMEAGNAAARMLGGSMLTALPVRLPSQPEWQHCVVVSHKEAETNGKYPRRAGLPGRKPLGM